VDFPGGVLLSLLNWLLFCHEFSDEMKPMSICLKPLAHTHVSVQSGALGKETTSGEVLFLTGLMMKTSLIVFAALLQAII